MCAPPADSKHILNHNIPDGNVYTGNNGGLFKHYQPSGSFLEVESSEERSNAGPMPQARSKGESTLETGSRAEGSSSNDEGGLASVISALKARANDIGGLTGDTTRAFLDRVGVASHERAAHREAAAVRVRTRMRQRRALHLLAVEHGRATAREKSRVGEEEVNAARGPHHAPNLSHATHAARPV